jgi:hypothetical protein
LHELHLCNLNRKFLLTREERSEHRHIICLLATEKTMPLTILKHEESSSSNHYKEQMLCNVVVRATHDLHFHQSKSADEITIYLNTDCENIGTKELVEQVS